MHFGEEVQKQNHEVLKLKGDNIIPMRREGLMSFLTNGIRGEFRLNPMSKC